MTAYDFKCLNTDCNFVFERNLQHEDKNPECPRCKSFTKRLIALRQTKKKFSEKLYPFFHQGLGEVVHSDSHLDARCRATGFESKHEGAYMTPKHERYLMKKRVEANPREIAEKATWSGRGAGLPTFETVDTETGDAPEPEMREASNDE